MSSVLIRDMVNFNIYAVVLDTDNDTKQAHNFKT